MTLDLAAILQTAGAGVIPLLGFYAWEKKEEVKTLTAKLAAVEERERKFLLELLKTTGGA